MGFWTFGKIESANKYMFYSRLSLLAILPSKEHMVSIQAEVLGSTAEILTSRKNQQNL